MEIILWPQHLCCAISKLSLSGATTTPLCVCLWVLLLSLFHAVYRWRLLTCKRSDAFTIVGFYQLHWITSAVVRFVRLFIRPNTMCCECECAGRLGVSMMRACIIVSKKLKRKVIKFVTVRCNSLTNRATCGPQAVWFSWPPAMMTHRNHRRWINHNAFTACFSKNRRVYITNYVKDSTVTLLSPHYTQIVFAQKLKYNYFELCIPTHPLWEFLVLKKWIVIFLSKRWAFRCAV